MVGGDGQLIRGRYRIDRKLGGSARHETWLVTDLKTSRPCVLKRLREAGAMPADSRLFEAQATVLARLDHPGIPRFVEHFVEGEGAAREQVLVMHYHPGESLERLVAKERLLTEAQAVALLRRLEPVLAYLHAFDPPLVHRSIKPANIIVGPDGRPCLTDLHFSVEGPGWKSWQEAPPGEDDLAVRAPEVALGGPVPASDIYAVGMATIFAMSGEDPAALPREGGRIRVRDVVRASEAFLSVLSRMVEPALERRYPDVRALEADLAKLVPGRISGLPAVPPVPPAPAKPAKPAKPIRTGVPPLRRSAFLTLAGVLLALAVGGGLFWLARTRRPPPPVESLVAPVPPAAVAPAPLTPAPVVSQEPEPAAVSATAPSPAGAPAPTIATEPAARAPGIAPPAPAPGPAAPPAPAEASPIVVAGRLLYDGQPIAGPGLPAPLFWFRDEASRAQVKPEVEYDAGAFKVRGLAPGRYGLSVRVDAERGNPNIFPGDFNAWAEFVLEAGARLELELPLRRIMHLRQPVDNGATLPGWDAPCGAGHPSPAKILFAWEPLDPAATYEVRIDRLACARGYVSAGSAYSRATTDPWVSVELPPSREGECYSFRLVAKKNGRQIGILTTHGKTGLGWDYRFAVR